MNTTLNAPQPQSAANSPWGKMPPRLRVLYVSTPRRTGAWLAEALAADSAADVHLEESLGATDGLRRLRDEIFDAVLVSHDPEMLDALALVDGVRGGGNEEPIIVLGDAGADEMDALCYEVGADAYLCVHTASTRSLIWTVARAVERTTLRRENQRLLDTERQRLETEKQEASRTFDELIHLLTEGSAEAELDADGDDSESRNHASFVLPKHRDQELPAYYAELLRTYVMMGDGSLDDEIAMLSENLCAARVTARQLLRLHLSVVDELVRGLGNRSARHVINRAGILAYEILTQMADGYRRRYLERHQPPQQLVLPGMEPPAAIIAAK